MAYVDPQTPRFDTAVAGDSTGRTLVYDYQNIDEADAGDVF